MYTVGGVGSLSRKLSKVTSLLEPPVMCCQLFIIVDQCFEFPRVEVVLSRKSLHTTLVMCVSYIYRHRGKQVACKYRDKQVARKYRGKQVARP